MKVKRSWQNMINIINMEDQTGFGYAFRLIPQFSNNYHSYLVFICKFSSCKEIWNIIDSKESPFRSSSWKGWLLTSVHHSCFQNNILSRIDNASPLKKPKIWINLLSKQISSFRIGCATAMDFMVSVFFFNSTLHVSIICFNMMITVKNSG